MKKFFIFLILMSSLVSCSHERLWVQSDYLTHEDLASTYVGSPDPRKSQPWAGQRLIVGWSIPKDYLQKPHIRLVLTLRYRNRDEAVQTLSLKESTGSYVYRLMNDEFFEKGGVLAYRAQIMAGENEVLEQWTHQVWSDLLEIEMSSES